MLLRVVIAAAFIQRLRFRVSWRRRWSTLSQRLVSDITPEDMQQALIELCVFEANRPYYILPLIPIDSDDDSDF